MKKTLEARVSSRRRYSCSPALLCWVPCSILSLQRHCPLKRRPWVNSGVTFHFCSPLRGTVGVRRSISDTSISFLELSLSHQSTLECSHLLLVPQTSKPNLLTIPEAPLHFLTPLFTCLSTFAWSTASPSIYKSLSKLFSAHLLGLHLTKSHPLSVGSP